MESCCILFTLVQDLRTGVAYSVFQWVLPVPRSKSNTDGNMNGNGTDREAALCALWYPQSRHRASPHPSYPWHLRVPTFVLNISNVFLIRTGSENIWLMMIEMKWDCGRWNPCNGPNEGSSLPDPRFPSLYSVFGVSNETWNTFQKFGVKRSVWD